LNHLVDYEKQTHTTLPGDLARASNDWLCGVDLRTAYLGRVDDVDSLEPTGLSICAAACALAALPCA